MYRIFLQNTVLVIIIALLAMETEKEIRERIVLVNTISLRKEIITLSVQTTDTCQDVRKTVKL